MKYLEKDYIRYNLPDLSNFKGTKKKGSPLEQFQQYLINQYGLEETKSIYPRLYLSKDDYTLLKKFVIGYAKLLYKDLSQLRFDFLVNSHMLDMSPNQFREDIKWVKAEYFYVKKQK